MPVIEDKEFGRITVRRSARSSAMKVSMAPNGTMRISVPSYAPIFMVKRMIASSREQLRTLRNTHPQLELVDGMSVGKSHHLLIRRGPKLTMTRKGTQLLLTLTENQQVSDADVIELARNHLIATLKREAKHYLPRRLERLASMYGHSYTKVRFSHSSGRWGSCNSKGVISLNIALMNLPYELIDYVIMHELAHTRYMDHSSSFWAEVETMDPEYKEHRSWIKNHSPSI
jgi:predicted metal-dependent hydrolase